MDPFGASFQSVPMGRAGPSSTSGIVLCFVFYSLPEGRLPWCHICFIVSTHVSLGLCCLYLLQLASDSLPTLGFRVPTRSDQDLLGTDSVPFQHLCQLFNPLLLKLTSFESHEPKSGLAKGRKG